MQRQRECPLCMQPLLQESARTILECMHVFHARCAHGPLTRNAWRCPVCAPAERERHQDAMIELSDAVEAADGDAAALDDVVLPGAVDLGDDMTTSDLLAQRRAIIDTVTDHVAHGEPLAAHRCDDARRRATPGNLVGALATSMTSDADDGATVRAMLRRGTCSATMLVEHGVDARRLMAERVTLRELLDERYGVNDLIVWHIVWEDLIAIGLTADVWRDHRAPLEDTGKQRAGGLRVRDLIKLYRITFDNVLGDVCRGSFKRVARIGFTADELAALGARVPSMFQQGMRREDIAAFDLPMRDWHDKLGMTSTMLALMHVDERAAWTTLGWIKCDAESGRTLDPVTLAEYRALYPPLQPNTTATPTRPAPAAKAPRAPPSAEEPSWRGRSHER